MLATNITPGNLSPSRPQLRPAAAHILGRDLAGSPGNPARPVAFRQGGPVFIPSPSIAGILAGAVSETRGNGRDPVRTAPLGERDGTAGMRQETGIAAGASLTVPAPSARRRPRHKAPRRAPRDQREKCEE
jgi:hypothetical protein